MLPVEDTLWSIFSRIQWIVLLLTSTVVLLLQLKLNPTIQLSRDKAIRNDHYHTRDEEQNKKKQDVPERRERKKNRLINKMKEKWINTDETVQTRPTKEWLGYSTCVSSVSHMQPYWLPKALKRYWISVIVYVQALTQPSGKTTKKNNTCWNVLAILGAVYKTVTS